MKTVTLIFTGFLLFCSTTASALTLDMVTVGNPGNAPDTRYGLPAGSPVGAVGYTYQIGKYEVTAGQYTEFLNAVAKADPNGLYNQFMDYDTYSMLGGPNIKRSGSSGGFSYSVAPDWANRPVSLVSFWDAVRFANWLHNGQPDGAQGPGTTEDGAYHDIGNLDLFGRNTGALFFIPTEDEWHKAAYHDKSAGLTASYFDYPAGTNLLPGRDMTEVTNPGNNANYYSSGYLIGSPYNRTVIGEFELSDSTYGTFDQGGNVWEWNETKGFMNNRRSLRGGARDSLSGTLRASYRNQDLPNNNNGSIGFRVGSIPEPLTVTMAAIGSLGLFLLRRRQ
jgi:formylglycine-generating enzyme